MFSLLTIFILVALGLGGLRLSKMGRRPPDYPPGPPTLPIIGNMHLFPSKDSRHQFQRWAQEYG